MSELGNFRFWVSLDPTDSYVAAAQAVASLALAPAVAVGGFREVTGLEGQLEVFAYAEGGQNDYLHQLPVRHSWSRIVLKRGLVTSISVWAWYRAGMAGSLGARRDGAIILQREDGIPAAAWMFRGGLASKWVGPTMNAQQSEVAIESIEIAHQGIEQLTLGI